MNITSEMLPKNYEEFLEKYKGNFEKRKYFKIGRDLEITERDPSWILELAYIYYENQDKKILDLISEGFTQCYKSKIKKIDRLSKYSIEELLDKFWRALLNKDGVHTIRLGNELILRDKEHFFELVYKYSFISTDVNKLIKVFFFELIYEKGVYNTEHLKNLLNYFSSSESEYIKYNSEDYLNYFNKIKTDILYKLIYEKVYKKYNIKKLDISADVHLNKEKQVIMNYLKSEDLL